MFGAHSFLRLNIQSTRVYLSRNCDLLLVINPPFLVALNILYQINSKNVLLSFFFGHITLFKKSFIRIMVCKQSLNRCTFDLAQ